MRQALPTRRASTPWQRSSLSRASRRAAKGSRRRSARPRPMRPCSLASTGDPAAFLAPGATEGRRPVLESPHAPRVRPEAPGRHGPFEFGCRASAQRLAPLRMAGKCSRRRTGGVRSGRQRMSLSAITGPCNGSHSSCGFVSSGRLRTPIRSPCGTRSKPGFRARPSSGPVLRRRRPANVEDHRILVRRKLRFRTTASPTAVLVDAGRPAQSASEVSCGLPALPIDWPCRRDRKRSPTSGNPVRSTTFDSCRRCEPPLPRPANQNQGEVATPGSTAQKSPERLHFRRAGNPLYISSPG